MLKWCGINHSETACRADVACDSASTQMLMSKYFFKCFTLPAEEEPSSLLCSLASVCPFFPGQLGSTETSSVTTVAEIFRLVLKM